MTLADLDRVAGLSNVQLREATQQYGLCAQNPERADDWFPPEPNTSATRARERYEHEAERLCRGCPVQEECLESALRAEATARCWGIAGGLAPWRREELLRDRRNGRRGDAA